MNQKLLFICSRNKSRSRTAEEIFRGVPGYDVKSAGTEPGARIRVTEGMLGWADVVFVMERKHADCLREKFPEAIVGKPVHNLRITDDFEFMDEDLIATLKSRLSDYVTVPDWTSAVSRSTRFGTRSCLRRCPTRRVTIPKARDSRATRR